MIPYSFDQYSPSLSDKKTAQSIYDELSRLNLRENRVEIDLTKMVAMTTLCARIIFGRLYLDLGNELFSQNVNIKGVSEALSIVINWGIESAIENKDL